MTVSNDEQAQIRKTDCMNNVDEIIGQKILKISLLTWDDNVNPIGLESICIDFGKYKLVLEVDPNVDELKYNIVNHFTIQALENQYTNRHRYN
jgi:hypothetical protein